MHESERELLQRVLVEASGQPEAQAQLASLGLVLLRCQAAAVLLAHELVSLLHRPQVMGAIVAAGEVVCAGVREIDASPPSVGYEPLLIGRGMPPRFARLSAIMILRIGERRARRINHERQAIPAALRSLSRPGRRRRIVARIAATLRALPGAEDAILAVFEGMGCDAQGQHFLALLDKAATSDRAACRELAGIAQSVAARIKTRRGRKISVESASHELALYLASTAEQPAGYTFDHHKGGFSDGMTLATKLEFGLADFDPRPALRRLRKEPP